MAFDLNKGIEQAEKRFKAKGFKLQKDDRANGLVARVWSVMDGSGSTRELWTSGTMQQAIQLVLPTAILVDDDGQLPVAVFNDGENVTVLGETMTHANHEGFVERNIVTRGGSTRISMFGGTDYSPVLRSVLTRENVLQTVTAKKKGWFGLGGGETTTQLVADPTASPIIIEFFTDGECGGADKEPTSRLLQELETTGCKVYVLFIGVGNPRLFGFIQQLADERGNVGFVNIENLREAVNSDLIMEQLLPDEMLGWLKK